MISFFVSHRLFLFFFWSIPALGSIFLRYFATSFTFMHAFSSWLTFIWSSSMAVSDELFMKLYMPSINMGTEFVFQSRLFLMNSTLLSGHSTTVFLSSISLANKDALRRPIAIKSRLVIIHGGWHDNAFNTEVPRVLTHSVTPLKDSSIFLHLGSQNDYWSQTDRAVFIRWRIVSGDHLGRTETWKPYI